MTQLPDEPATAPPNADVDSPDQGSRGDSRVEFDRVPWRRVGVFMLISYGLFALFAAPFWVLPGGVRHPSYSLVIGAGMWTPAIASVILAKGVEKTSWRTRVGLRFRGRWRSLLLWTLVAVGVVMAVHVVTAVAMILRGVPGDLTGGTWMRIVLEQMSAASGSPVGPAQAVGLVALTAVAGLLVTCVLALGEEIGWRGWLWPALRPLGRLRAAAAGGVIWAMWHLPIVLIGHNYTGAPRHLAVAMFILPCIAMTLLFGALTDRADGNPLPAAAAHGTMNSQFGTVLAIVATTQTPAAMNLFIDTPLGIIGVVALLVAGLVLGMRGLKV